MHFPALKFVLNQSAAINANVLSPEAPPETNQANSAIPDAGVSNSRPIDETIRKSNPDSRREKRERLDSLRASPNSRRSRRDFSRITANGNLG